jgi:hypothetical protein
MSNNKSIPDILKEVNATASNEGKLEILQENDSKMLRYLLQASFDDNVQTLLPDGEPPYTPAPKDQQVTLYDLEADFPKLFKNGPMSKAPLIKVEQVFMGMLSKLSSEEGKVLILAKDKRLNSMYKRLKKPFIAEFLKSTVAIK